MSKKINWLLVGGLVFWLSCDNHRLGFQQQSASLTKIDDCTTLLTTLKKGAIEQMRVSLEENLQYALEGHGCYWEGCGDYGPCYEEDMSGGAVPSDSSSNQGGAKSYSTTNTQEANVDEADFLKNDNKFIYILAGNEFRIYQAWPPTNTHLISTTEIDGTPRNLFVQSGHALIYTDMIESASEKASGDYYCGEWGCGQPTNLKISIFDLQEIHKPRLERELILSGSYVNSRRIQDFVYTVIDFPEIYFPNLMYWPSSLDCSREFSDLEIAVAFAELEKQNIELIEATEIEDWIPSVQDTRYRADGSSTTISNLLQSCDNFYEPSMFDGQGFLTLLSLNIQNDKIVNLASIIGNRGVVYASEKALYVASTPYSYGWYGSDNQEVTTIHKFALADDKPQASYAASGAVGGRVLNQFSMGEHQNTFRIATTTGYLPSPDAFNSVYVLRPIGDTLAVVGQLDHIAPTEDIRSARFVGDRGFVVTFKKTDPLFAIDLSVPERPRIAGELKIPGFSTYIHMMDENHLLTIGFDAADQGDFAWFTGIQLQIFDVKNLDNPQLIHKTSIGTRGTSSEATGNHLAFNYFPPKDLLALPMAICEGGDGSNGQYGDVLTFSGLLVFDVTAKNGFSEKGRVHFEENVETDPYGYNSSCSNWWQNPNSRVKRSIIMDDYVFSIAEGQMKVNHLDNLGDDLVVLDLPTLQQDGPLYY